MCLRTWPYFLSLCFPDSGVLFFQRQSDEPWFSRAADQQQKRFAARFPRLCDTVIQIAKRLDFLLAGFGNQITRAQALFKGL